MGNTAPEPPVDVLDQTMQIVQSRVAEMVYAGAEVDGTLGELLFWAGFQPEKCCTLLCVFVARRDGGSGNGIVRQSAVTVARNSVNCPTQLAGGGVIDFPRLQMLERLAVGAEDFELRPELQLVRNSTPVPGRSFLPIAPGEVVTVEAVRFANVGFNGGRVVGRDQVTATYFSLPA